MLADAEVLDADVANTKDPFVFETEPDSKATGAIAEMPAGTDAAADEWADVDALPDPPPPLPEVELHGCKWISGEPTPLRAGLFCSRPTLRGWSWCADHYRVAFGKRASQRVEARPRAGAQ